MAVTVGAFEAKTKFSELLDRVEHGEEVVITRRGKEVARLTGLPSKRTPEESQAIYEDLMAIGRRSRKIIEERGITATSLDHDEFFYDEFGLPK
jgi:prevent-host-death family protein